MKEKFDGWSLLTGTVLIIAGFLMIFFPETGWIISTGTSLLASGIVIVVTALIKERIKVNPLDEWSIKNVYTTRQQMNDDCDIANYNATKQIDVIAFGLKHFREEVDVERILKRGVNFNILTMDPECEFISQREKEEGKDPGYISKSIKDLISWADELNRKHFKGKITVKGYSCMTLDYYWRADEEMYCGPYWYDYDSQATVSYCFKKGGKAYRVYEQYFDKLWNNTDVVRKLTK